MSGSEQEREPAEPPRLAERIAAGDPAAEAELVARFRRGVVVIARRACGDVEQAQDVAQEVFRVALERIRSGAVNDPDRLPGFMASLARNLAVEADRARRECRRRGAGESEAQGVAARGASPLEAVLQAEEQRQAREVLEEVATGRDREVLRRVYLAGEHREEVCRALGLSRLQLTRVLFRARERFRALWLSRSELER